MYECFGISCFRFELSTTLTDACNVYAQWLEDSTQVTSKDLVSSNHKLSLKSLTSQYLEFYGIFVVVLEPEFECNTGRVVCGFEPEVE